MSAKAQEDYQETLEKAKDDWNKFKDNIERYDTLITDDIPGLEADIRAALDQQIEIKLEAFEYEIEIRFQIERKGGRLRRQRKRWQRGPVIKQSRRIS